MRVNDIPKEAAENPVIFDSYVKAQSVLKQYECPYCAISGGADSDVMLDIMARLDRDKTIQYIWYNTGLEYAATKKHLNYLEERYDVKIERQAAVKPVPVCVFDYGVPFVNKHVSEMIQRLQSHGFDFRDGSYDELVQEYPNCQTALSWWTDNYTARCGHGCSMFNIAHNPGLKEFLLENPPTFKISSKCCDYAKKKTAHVIEKGKDLSITGIRRAEGGSRTARHSNCYTQKDGVSEYRPLFWYSDADKEEYNRIFNIKNSDCYEVWGLQRTGCVGCPFGRDTVKELEAVKKYEPGMYRACMKVFGQSYEYTAKYREFQKKRKEEADAGK